MISLCKTCTYFMLVRVEFIGGMDLVEKACLVKPDIFDKLKVGHSRDKHGIDHDVPNVKSCTHYNRKEEI